MKTFIITISGKTEIDIYNALGYVLKLVHKHHLSGEGTLVRGFLEGFGNYNFKCYGYYDKVLTKELEQILKEAEDLIKEMNIFVEDSHDYLVKELSPEEKNEYKKINPEVVLSMKNPTNSIIFDIVVSGESEYAVEQFIKWVYDKVCQRTLFHRLSRITMLPGNSSGYFYFKSYGKYQSTYQSISENRKDGEDEFDDIYNSKENRNSYCSACQQDPCECSDREKTSAIYDF